MIANFRIANVFLIMALSLALLAGCAGTSSTQTPAAPPQNTNTNTGQTGQQPAADPPKEEPKSKFPEKNITFVVPVSPGGGFDTLSRMFAPYWEKHLPNDTKVVVENKPGGEWNIGLAHLFKSDPDGYTVGILNIPGNSINQLRGSAAYDLNEFSYIGRLSDVVYVMAASKQSGVKSVEDLKKIEGLKSGNVGLSSSGGLGTVIAAERLGLDMTVIPHDGSNEAIISAMQGTVHYVQFPYSTLKKAIVDSDDLTPILVFAEERLEDLPDVPTVKELGMGDLLSVISLHRIVAGPPGIPEDELKILRETFEKATADPEFKEKMLAEDSSYNPGNAEIAKQLSISSLEEFKKYMPIVEKYSK